VTVQHPEADNKGFKYTEPEMNKIAGRPLPESKLADEFDKPTYGLLVVAEKYQTGFDQPNLCGMYVDKKLVGVNAVQTLSRLNRSARGKDEVYVLDFRNTTDEIRKAFEPFYERTEGEPSELNVLFDAADAVRGFGVITDAELGAFIDAWAQLEEVDEDRRHAILSTSTQRAYLAAQDLDADARRKLREALNRFVRFYSFLSQALPWIPGETEVLFQFSKILLARLQSEIVDGGVDLSGTVTLTHYRLSALDEDSIQLGGDAKPLKAITGDGGNHGTVAPISMGELGQLVEVFNNRYGAELGPDDALAVVTAVRDTVHKANPELAEQAQANSRGDFISDRDDLLIDAALSVGSDRERQTRLLKALLDDDDFRERAGSLIFGSIYDAAAGAAGGQASA
jgi:type I restriction enzyme R subunit